MTFSLQSRAFAANGPIPKDFAQESTNKSPRLRWAGAPSGTKSFVLVLKNHDVLVGTVAHWIVYNIDANAEGLLEGLQADQALQAANYMGHFSYSGPKPPRSHGAHR